MRFDPDKHLQQKKTTTASQPKQSSPAASTAANAVDEDGRPVGGPKSASPEKP